MNSKASKCRAEIISEIDGKSLGTQASKTEGESTRIKEHESHIKRYFGIQIMRDKPIFVYHPDSFWDTFKGQRNSKNKPIDIESVKKHITTFYRDLEFNLVDELGHIGASYAVDSMKGQEMVDLLEKMIPAFDKGTMSSYEREKAENCMHNHRLLKQAMVEATTALEAKRSQGIAKKAEKSKLSNPAQRSIRTTSNMEDELAMKGSK